MAELVKRVSRFPRERKVRNLAVCLLDSNFLVVSVSVTKLSELRTLRRCRGDCGQICHVALCQHGFIILIILKKRAGYPGASVT